MSDWEERRNLLKRQNRFQAKQPHYRDKYRKLFPGMTLWEPWTKEGIFRTFELGDPRDPDLLPRIIGYMPVSVIPVWSRFWAVKNVSKAAWASWLRELASLGLEPVDIPRHRLGLFSGLSEPLAKKLCRLLLNELSQLAAEEGRASAWVRNGGRYIPWLLRGLNFRNIRCLLPNGTIQQPAHVRMSLTTVLGTDCAGRIWFDN